MTSPPEVDLPSPGHRVVALDALRGIAALAVVLAHITATNPVVYHPGSTTSWPNWLTRLTPIHLLWYGPTAVVVFFVLSGYVLTMPFLRRAHRGPEAAAAWAGFYPKRLVRLYLPAWGALVLALGFALFDEGRTSSGASAWLTINTPSPSISRAAHDALLVFGVSSLDSPLWTLGLEVVASMLLPAFVLLALVRRVPLWLRCAALLLVITAAGAIGSRSIGLLGTFGLGALLASVALDDPAWVRAVRGWAWAVVLLASLVLMNAGALLSLVRLHHHIGGTLATLLPSIGSLGVVATVVFWSAAARSLTSAPFEWLGSRSFSLYLTHFPFVIALAYVIDPRDLLLLCVVGVAGSLLIAEAFTRLVERPSHALAKRVGRSASGWALARRQDA